MATTNDRFLLGTRKGCFEARRQQGRWSLRLSGLAGKTLPYVVRDARDGSVWASLDHGHWGCKLARSKDDGSTFLEIPPPKYPEATGKAARYYWVLTPGHADEPERFYIGTEPGGLFSTVDGAATWQLDAALWALCTQHEWTGGGRDHAGVHSISVDPRDARRLVVAVSCAGVLQTRDRGASWQYINSGMSLVSEPNTDETFGHDPHCVVRAPSNPDVLWQANHMGVYVSRDAGATWNDLTSKPWVHFGFPIAVHPTDARVAWIVPMESDMRRVALEGRLVVMQTRDGGVTWSQGCAGLPQQNAFDFPYRHALDVGVDGDVLAFGTTSGNVYVSEDGGHSWHAIAHNLPPVYSLRFA